MKTAMQELLDHLESYDMNINTEFYKGLLEKEKEQIMDATKNGISHGYTEGVVFGTNPRDYILKWSENYYNQTYNQNK